MPIVNRVADLHAEITGWRRDLHAHPELQYDVHRTAAGTYTISFTMGVIVPIISGAIWDFTGLPWLTFVPLAICAMTLTVFGMWAFSYAPRPGA